MRIVLTIALAGVAFAPPAPAHGDLPHADWCVAGTVAHVAEFKLSAQDIARSAMASTGTGTFGSARIGAGLAHCGQFDPPYTQARTAGLRVCDSYSLATYGATADVGMTTAIVRGPASYLDERHHEIYRVEDGLHVECVICLPPGD